MNVAPMATRRFDALMALVLTLMIGGFFSDLWAHSHGQVETFFTIWHLALYSAAGVVFLILAGTAARARRAGAPLRAVLPQGYGTSLVGAVLFLIGGLLDMLWHLAFGIEANVSALFSPTHILLFTAGVLMVSGPLRAAWSRGDDERTPWRARLPMVVSAALVLTVLTAMTMFIDPIVDPFAETTDPAAKSYAEIYTMRPDGTRQTRDIAVDGAHAFAPTWSPDGRRLAFTSGLDRTTVMIANADGTDARPVAALAGRESLAGSWSPDGSQLAISVRTPQGGFAIELLDVATGRTTRLSGSDAHDGRPMFSPDGRSIAFNSRRDGRYAVYVMRADGSEARRVAAMGESWGPAWSPDGRRLAFNSDVTGHQEIYVMNADGSELRQVTHAAGWSTEPSWSPDGARLAFAGERGAAHDIFAVNLDGTGETNLTRTPGRDEWAVSWSKDGTLAYTVGEYMPSDLVPEVREKLGLASVLVQSALIAGMLLLALLRGGLPFGALTIVLGFNAALMSVINDEYRLIPAALIAGIGSDLVIRRLRPSADRVAQLRIVAFFVPASYFAAHLVTLALGPGIGWPIHLWTGSVLIAGSVGLLLAYAMARPAPSVREATG